MKKILFTLIAASGLTQTIQAQVDCDMMNLIVNVGSDTNMVNIYHPGHYLTWPPEETIIVWEIADNQGNIIAEDSLIDEAFYQFSHNIPITDTMNVTAVLINDSAGTACLIEDQLYWKISEVIPGVFTGRWEFLYGNVGVDVTNTVGVFEIEPTTAIVYPNPSRDVVNISLERGQIEAIEIYNLTGCLVFKTNMKANNINLKVDSYPSGTYLMRIFDQDNVVTNSFMVKD
jgi:hypothetical protein